MTNQLSATASLGDYGAWDDAQIATELAEAAEGGRPKRYLGKLEVGRTILRIGPAMPGRKSPFMRPFIHSIEVPGVKNSVRFCCPRLNQPKGAPPVACKTCSTVARLMASQNPIDVERGENLGAYRQTLCNAMRRNDPSGGFKLWAVSKKLYEDLMKLADKAAGLGVNFAHPVTGTDIYILRVGTTKTDTRYTVNLDPRGASRLAPTDEAALELLATMSDLEREVIIPTEEEIAMMLRGEKVNLHDPMRAPAQPALAAPAQPTAASRIAQTGGRVPAQVKFAPSESPVAGVEELDDDGFPVG
jgi:hypothetical protein